MSEDDELIAATVGVLGDRAMHIDEIRRALVERGTDTGTPDPHGIDRLGRLLQLDEQLFRFLDDRVAYVPSALRDVRWSVRVTERDAERGFTAASNGLDAIFGWLMARHHAGHTVLVVDHEGTELGAVLTDGFFVDDADTDVIIWPHGTLDEFVDSHFTISIIDEGSVRIEAQSDVSEAAATLAPLARRAFDATKRAQTIDTLLDDDATVIEVSAPAELLVQMVLIDSATCRATIVPQLDDLLDAAGLEQHRRYVGPADTDWEVLDSEFRLRRAELEHDFDREQAKRLVLLTGAATARDEVGALALGETDSEIAGALTLVAGILEDPAIAEAAWNHWSDHGHTETGLDDIVDRLNESFGDDPPPGVAWLRARNVMMHDRTTGAIALLEQAAQSGTDVAHAGVLVDLAAFAADRSNPGEARRLLDAAGIDTAVDLDAEFDPITADHGFGAELAEEIAPFVAIRPRPMAGRNEPCPCGSGRKYKQCHLGNELHPIEHRAGWLYVKMMRFLGLVAPAMVDTIVDEIAGELFDPALQRMVANSYLPTDIALHEGGIGVRFSASKASLLPADEIALVETWNATRRSVYEVVRSTHDTMDVVDLASRQRLTVRDTVPEEPLEAGWKVLGRLLPVGDDVRAYGGFLPINDDMVEPLVAAFETAQLETTTLAIAQVFEAAEAHDEMQQLFDDSIDTSELESLIESLTDDA